MAVCGKCNDTGIYEEDMDGGSAEMTCDCPVGQARRDAYGAEHPDCRPLDEEKNVGPRRYLRICPRCKRNDYMAVAEKVCERCRGGEGVYVEQLDKCVETLGKRWLGASGCNGLLNVAGHLTNILDAEDMAVHGRKDAEDALMEVGNFIKLADVNDRVVETVLLTVEGVLFPKGTLVAGTCRVCGCTDGDCSGCIEVSGHPCSWVEEDLCSRCADGILAVADAAAEVHESQVPGWEAAR